MLEKTIKAVQEMDAVVVSADATKKKTFEYISANYRNKSELMNQKIEEMNNSFNEACGKAADHVREVLTEEVQDAENRINAIVCAEVPATFANDLTVIKTREKDMSDYEVELYVNKYIHNYPATAALHVELAKNYEMARMMHVVKPEKLIEELEHRKDDIFKLISGYDPTGYVARVMRTERNPIVQMAERVQAFIDGNYMIDTDLKVTTSGALPV